MLYLTQLVYLHAGQEKNFEDFEAVALPLLGRYGGELMLRLRPDAASVIGASAEVPYELHLVRFPDEDALARYLDDDERRGVLPLKERSVRDTLLLRSTLD